MINYRVISLGEALEVIGTTELLKSFSSFSCENEKDLEDFLLNKAISYEQSGKGKTFLLFDEDDYITKKLIKIVAYYTLAIQALILKQYNLWY